VSEPRLPGNLSHIERLLKVWATEEHVTEGRLRRRLAVFVVAAMFDGLRDEDGNHRFIVKGGSALELRFGARARSSRDLDAVYRGNLDEAHDLIEGVLREGWNGFGGRATAPERIAVPGIRHQPVRMELKLTYKRKSFASLPLELSSPEGNAVRVVDTVAVRPVDVMQLPLPTEVPCLSVRYQIAQKLHACTDPLDGVRLNERAHDLADLMLLTAGRARPRRAFGRPHSSHRRRTPPSPRLGWVG
jgi:hypothetical protein